MARLLIVGGGCRAEDLARWALDEVGAVRMTTRSPQRAERIEALGAEPHLGDPDRIGTLAQALDNVTLLCWLLGTASGPPEQVAALHGSRLGRMLEETVDTTVRGVVYEAAGTAPQTAFARGCEEIESVRAAARIPCEIVSADPAARGQWLAAMREAVGRLIST